MDCVDGILNIGKLEFKHKNLKPECKMIHRSLICDFKCEHEIIFGGAFFLTGARCGPECSCCSEERRINAWKAGSCLPLNLSVLEIH